MRVFVTGASGWIGSAALDELLAHGHEVVGLARTDASAASIEAKGAQVRRGDLDDLDSLRAGAADSEAVVHLANKHDFINPAVSNKAEHDAVQAMGDVLAGSGRALLVASGVAGPRPGPVLTENDASPFHGPDSPRGGSENLALEFAGRDVRAMAVRFAPTVHGMNDHGFISVLVGVAQEKKMAGYVGDGTNRWAAVHRSDAAQVIRLALEKAPAGSILHAIGEDGIPAREIAEAMGRGLMVPARSVAPDDAADHFGWIGNFFGMEMSASSVQTQKLLGWTPSGPTLLDDLAAGAYFEV